MVDMALTLYSDRFWISPFVFTCYVALKEKGVPFEIAELGLDRKDHLRPDYRDRSLTGRVPAIDHDGFWLSESQAIVEYLDDAFAPPVHARVLPAEARQRARARQVLAWLRSDLNDLRRERPTTTMFYERAQEPLTAAGQAAAERLLHIAGLLIPDGASSLFGAWTIADSDLAFMLQRLLMNGHEVPGKVRAFVEAQWQRDSVHSYVVHARPEYVAY